MAVFGRCWLAAQKDFNKLNRFDGNSLLNQIRPNFHAEDIKYKRTPSLKSSLFLLMCALVSFSFMIPYAEIGSIPVIISY